MSIDQDTRTLGHSARPERHSAPVTAPEVDRLLVEVEARTAAVERMLSTYLATVARGFARLKIAEDAVAAAVADAMAALSDADRALFVEGLAALPGYAAPPSPNDNLF